MNLSLLGLLAILCLVLLLPFSVKYVEEKLELFLFAMGVLAVSISGQWSGQLIHEALKEPLMISVAVLLAGLAFRGIRWRVEGWVQSGLSRFGPRITVALIVIGLGLISSVVTAIIAALLLAEIASALKLPRALEIKIVVLACFSIGLGAALTPLGEPLAAIAVARLRGDPHFADFWFLLRLLGVWVLPMLLVLGIGAAFLAAKRHKIKQSLKTGKAETFKDVLVRTGKVYLFVMALVFLGQGFAPVVDRYLTGFPSLGLYWINIVSAALDNATLAAAEISPKMDSVTIRDILLGLLISGGMLIPGNIPNIICAGKLEIKSREWAAFGVPAGLVMMTAVFLILMFI